MPGDDPVEALAVDVDDPHDVAEALQRGVGDGLPDVALVELGVADEGDEAGRALRPEVGLDVAAGLAGEQRGATAPRPTEPVEKSNTSGSLVRRG